MKAIRQRLKAARPLIQKTQTSNDDETCLLLAWVYRFVPAMADYSMRVEEEDFYPDFPADIERLAQEAIVEGWPEETTLHHVAKCSAYRFDTEHTPTTRLYCVGVNQPSVAEFGHCDRVDELRALLTLASSVRVFLMAQAMSATRNQPIVTDTWTVTAVDDREATYALARTAIISYAYVAQELCRIK